MRPAAFGMADEGGGVAVLGGNFDLLVDHGRFSLAFSRFLDLGVEYDCKETGT